VTQLSVGITLSEILIRMALEFVPAVGPPADRSACGLSGEELFADAAMEAVEAAFASRGFSAGFLS
jgi:hypothetical protein